MTPKVCIIELCKDSKTQPTIQHLSQTSLVWVLKYLHHNSNKILHLHGAAFCLFSVVRGLGEGNPVREESVGNPVREVNVGNPVREESVGNPVREE